MNAKEKIKAFLQEYKNQRLKEFNAKLIPNINADCVLGISLPTLRKFAKELYSTCDCTPFLQDLPHQFHEENHLHAFLIEQIKDYGECIRLTQEFLPFVDNWAVCDCFKPPVFKKNKQKLLVEIIKWLTSAHAYTIRYGVCMLLTHFLDGDFTPDLLECVAKIKSQDYYVQMVIAWYFATALAKQYGYAIKYLQEKRLCSWVHNKTIRKAIESFRITKEQKQYLKTLKVD